MSIKDNEYHRKNYQDRKDRGLCTKCAKPPIAGKTLCEYCNFKYLQRSKNRAQRLKTVGNCIRCGQEKASHNKTMCPNCSIKINQIQRDKETLRAISGQCIKCGEPNARDHNYCEVCRLKMISTNIFKNVSGWKSLMELFQAQHGKCPYTGRLLTLGADAELDHIIPKSKGGPDDLSNLQWVHRSINRMKHELTQEEFFNLIKEVYDFIWVV